MFSSEKDLENYICENQENFIDCLKEIYGEDNNIKFLGRQVDLGNRENIADLIYYYDDILGNEKYRTFVIVELKNRKLQPRDLSQLSRYINLLQNKLK